MKFASEEIRTKAVHAYLTGKASAKKLAEIFGYTPCTILNWVRAYKTQGQTAPKPNGHRKSCFTEEELEQLTSLLESRVDMTLEEIRAHFNKACSLTAIHKIVKKLGFVYKKNLKGKRAESGRYKTKAR